MASRWSLLLFNACLLITSIGLVLSIDDVSNPKPVLKLSVHPSSGFSTENIELRCQISSLPTISSLSSAKFDNIFLSVTTDNVKPSGILLKFDDGADKCVSDRKPIHVDVCNATLIVVHINHTVLNETLQQINYKCSKGGVSATTSFNIINPSGRYFDPAYSSSSSLTHTLCLLLFVVFLTRIITTADIQ